MREPVDFVNKGVLDERLRFLGHVIDAVNHVETVFDGLEGQRQVLGCNGNSVLLV